MIPIPIDQGLDIFFMPFVEQAVVIILPFSVAPSIESLVPNQQAHLISQFQQFGCRWIVGGTDGIASHLPQHTKLPMQGTFIESRS